MKDSCKVEVVTYKIVCINKKIFMSGKIIFMHIIKNEQMYTGFEVKSIDLKKTYERRQPYS